MDFSFSAEDREFQREVRAWLDEAWPEPARERRARSALARISKAEQMRWQQKLAERGWAAPNWPVEHGGAGFTATQNYIFDLEMARAGAPRVLPFGITMVAPVIMKFGTEEQKRRFLPDILHSRVWWCQGYSEPGSGSDLASLRMKAEDKGDHYLVNGVKTWTTLAQHADWIFCLVRTSTEERRQLGISFLLIDMQSPGVTVKPIITLDQPVEGFQEINTVYFEDVEVPKANRIGEEGRGWTCAKYLLEFERGNAYSPALKQSLAGLEALAAAAPLIEDEDFTARLRDLEVQVLAMEFVELRILGALSAGQNVGPESSMLKTRGTELQQAVAELALELCGYYGFPLDQSTPLSEDLGPGFGPAHANGAAQYHFNTRKVSIYAGSNEIQRNIMAKLVLGL
ncbi:MAG: pimeloyl-CoA dehydrogenase large subunit [Gammaproteobacteria bacterium]|nr:pimeloyl-CoA dehydrogenase large subunit [Gammaproteobacteria bacterium]MYE52409.1 pimeloyl-CoA dehydrogenase large subunit [Gammaproteobacteria bacterium]MYF48812.1 pimeloyl-CoA dehydrogenase large subunit [Gammaproteobacteria bacterium]